jgi:hypothetical protein
MGGNTTMRPGQREFEAILPIGYIDEGGRGHRRAVLRKMRGHEEALLYDPTLSAGQLVTALIHSCLLRLGDLEAEAVDAELVSQLYTADRNYLLLELRRITLGDRLQASYLCPRCGSDVPVVEDLGQIPVRRLEEGSTLADIELELEDGYVDRDGAHHTDLVLTLPRGADEEHVSPLAARDPLKAQDALLLRCIKRFGTLPKAALEAYGVKILRDLTLGDRQRLQQALNGQMPGVDFRRSVHCGGCGTAFEGVLDVSGFFTLS